MWKFCLLVIPFVLQEMGFLGLVLVICNRSQDITITTITSHGHGQVKECKIILEQSLLTGWLAGWLTSWLSELSTSFPISSDQARKNAGMKLRLPVTSSQMHTKEKPCACQIDRRVQVSVKVLKVLVQEG